VTAVLVSVSHSPPHLTTVAWGKMVGLLGKYALLPF